MGLGIKVTEGSQPEEGDNVFNRLYKKASGSGEGQFGLTEDLDSSRKDALYNDSKIRTIRDLIKVQDKYSTVLTESTSKNFLISGNGGRNRREFLVAKMDSEKWFG
jgi:hypothetical protein